MTSFTDSDLALINKLQYDPSILLLGQSYYKLDNSKNLPLDHITKKYLLEDKNSFYSLFDIKGISDDAIRSWLQKMFENLSLPESIKICSEFPWSNVYTTAIDSNLEKLFKNDLRSVQPVFDTNYKIVDPRSRSMLHMTYLYGQIQFSDSIKGTPLKKLDKKARQILTDQLLHRLQRDIVTPKGILVIEGWDPVNDWLSSENLYGYLNTFAKQQVHIFSFTHSYMEDEYLSDLINKNIVIPHTEKLSQFISSSIENKLLNISELSSDNDGIYLFFGNKRVNVPETLVKSLKKVGLLISKKNFDVDKNLTDNELISYFRRFISFSPTIPDWRGYSHALAFKRDFIEEILKSVKNTNIDYPIIVHGQASSGKTIGLGQVVFELINDSENKSAVLFIERSYKRLDENSLAIIDEFGLWAEENGADRTIIIYDGMLSYESYYSLVNNLGSKGRKVVLIGSSYINDVPKKGYINVDIELTPNEKSRFANYIEKFVPDLPALGIIIKNQANKNFLSVLYHFLPESKTTIKDLIWKEARFYLDSVKENFSFNNKEVTKNLILKDILLSLGFEENNTHNINSELTIGGENGEIATHFINMVMCIGKHGLSVPFELLIRALGDASMKAEFFNSISNTDFIRWKDDHLGNITVGPRTTLEASIYTYTLGGIGTEVSFIKKILGELRDSYQSTQEDKEVEFASQLLQILKRSGSPFRKFMYEYALILGTLRKSRQAVHPRLMLQEASLLQESVKDSIIVPEGVEHIDLLEDAENVIREALEIERINSPTYLFLKVELASILGSQAKKTRDKGEAKSLFNDARTEILGLQFSTNNYHALDVLLWTTRDQATITTDISELSQLKVKAEGFLQFGADEGFAVEHQEDFLRRKQELGVVFKDFVLSDQAFDELKISGSKAGYFLRAKEFLKDVDIYVNTVFGSTDLQKINNALQYLNDHFSEIKLDQSCLYLYLKLWWLSKNHHPIFFKEKNGLKFSTDEWMQLLSICSLLLEITEKYISPTITYLKAIAEFHIRSDNYVQTFRGLSEESERTSVGSRRIKKFYLYSNPDGTPQKLTGIIESDLDFRNSSALITVPGINRKIKALYSDFRYNYRNGDSVDFYIAFNFIGPTAISRKNI